MNSIALWQVLIISGLSDVCFAGAARAGRPFVLLMLPHHSQARKRQLTFEQKEKHKLNVYKVSGSAAPAANPLPAISAACYDTHHLGLELRHALVGHVDVCPAGSLATRLPASHTDESACNTESWS